MLSRRTGFACSCAAVLLLLAAPSSAQTTFATITGTVTDPTGSIVPNVTVTATHTATNISTTAESNEAGVFTVAQLKEGVYTVRARKAGFKEFAAQNIVLSARDYRRVDIRLEVGAVETVVEVQGGATLIETETARISDTRSFQMMRSLPLNTRSIWAHLNLAPNVVQAAAGSSTIRFAGSRSNQAHWAIDGITMADGSSNTQMGPLANYIEWMEEIRIDISNNTAEFGTLGQVTSISKSGTNALHGSAYEIYGTPLFRAANPFFFTKSRSVSHGPGASLSGPVYLPKIYSGKERTFFFFSFETSRGSSAITQLNPTVPLVPWRQGDFSALSTVVRDPASGTAFDGNRIPRDRLNTTSLKIQDRFYPAPNFGNTSVLASQNYRETKTRPNDPSTNVTIRGDHRFSQSDSIFGRYSFQRGFSRGFEGNLPTIGRRFQQRDNRALGLSYTHVFKPSLLNEFRYGYANNLNPVIGPIRGRDIVQELGLVGLAPDLPDISGILKVNWTGLGLTNITQPDYTTGSNHFLKEWQDHVSWFHGRHNFKFGGHITRVEWDQLSANGNLFGSVTFSNRFTAFPYADFLLGIPTTAARAFPPVNVERRRWQMDFFATDDFKVTPRLTLNVGVRYQYHPVWTEENGRGSMFDIGTGKIVIQDGSLSEVSPLFPRGYVEVVEASALGLPGSTIIRSDRNNWAPRLGLAWRPWSNRTVFRTGFGIYYDVASRNLNHGGIPFVINEPSFTNPAGAPTVILPRVFPDTGSGGVSTVGIPAAIATGLKIPYSMQYNMTLEHTRWDTGFRLSYVGTNTRQGDWSYNYNSPVPDARPYVDKPRPFPQYPGISYFTNGAGHQYHALTLEAERRMARGLYFQASWAWARDIGDLERGESPENPFDRRRERAVWLDIPTHRVTINSVYQFPFGRGRTFLTGAGRGLNLLVGGWEISGVYGLYTGEFLTPTWTGPDPVGIAFTSNRTPANVTLRPDHLSNTNLPESERRVNRWFDTGAFAGPALGRFGTSAKGVIKGPGTNTWHLGVFKYFEISDRGLRLRLQLTATNAFNHPNWSNPGVSITSPQQFGVISNVGGVNGASTGDIPGPRSFGAGLRVEW